MYGVRRCGSTEYTALPPKGRKPAAAKSRFLSGGFEGKGLSWPAATNGLVIFRTSEVGFVVSAPYVRSADEKKGNCPLNWKLSSASKCHRKRRLLREYWFCLFRPA